MRSETSPARLYALVLGAVLVVAGIIGVVPARERPTGVTQ
jgi:hypothetical protein